MYDRIHSVGMERRVGTADYSTAACAPLRSCLDLATHSHCPKHHRFVCHSFLFRFYTTKSGGLALGRVRRTEVRLPAWQVLHIYVHLSPNSIICKNDDALGL